MKVYNTDSVIEKIRPMQAAKASFWRRDKFAGILKTKPNFTTSSRNAGYGRIVSIKKSTKGAIAAKRIVRADILFRV